MKTALILSICFIFISCTSDIEKLSSVLKSNNYTEAIRLIKARPELIQEECKQLDNKTPLQYLLTTGKSNYTVIKFMFQSAMTIQQYFEYLSNALKHNDNAAAIICIQANPKVIQQKESLIMELLYRYVYPAGKSKDTVLKAMLQSGLKIKKQLQYAVFNGRMKMIDMLFRCGANFKKYDYSMWIPLPYTDNTVGWDKIKRLVWRSGRSIKKYIRESDDYFHEEYTYKVLTFLKSRGLKLSAKFRKAFQCMWSSIMRNNGGGPVYIPERRNMQGYSANIPPGLKEPINRLPFNKMLIPVYRPHKIKPVYKKAMTKFAEILSSVYGVKWEVIW